ncbi:MAG: dihydroorotate dehydrogenase electron transfer subunit [Clostridia bacterium]|nr:dihydroorotate dehydrogenase electron transfer subunit [Clostridia bacterium]MBO5669991.1 dihydroorotate dehydrogenase electron transfer subunit [Clostridia bacterium]
MKQSIFIIKENIALTHDVWKMVLEGDTSEITRPGQFVNILLDGLYLRRPISVHDAEDGVLTLIYKIVGVGTARMSEMKPGHSLDVLTGLGNGYDVTRAGARPLLIGGGVGVPPLYMLAKQLCAAGCEVTVILGFRSARDVFCKEAFEALGARVLVTTEDGTYGTRGFVTGVFDEAGDYTYTYSCGPEPMLRAVYNASGTSGEYSFEERMGCGFGACMGCSCKTLYGNKRICKDGPVLVKEEIVWEK